MQALFGMMKITFLIPPVFTKERPAERTAGCTTMVYPMANIYELTVAAVLEQEGYTVCYEDFISTKRGVEAFQSFLQTDDSQVYVFWSVNLSIRNDLEASERIRRFSPQAYIVYLGPAPTFYVKEFLQHSRQVVVRGEPEMTVKEVCHHIADSKDFSEIKGISVLDSSGVVRNNLSRELLKNLDTLPFPARHLINKHYFSNPKLKRSPYTAMVTSRNCPFHCIYCVPSSLTFARELESRAYNGGKKPFASMRTPENVVAEIDLLAAEGYKAIGFLDDNFIITEKRLLPIAEALKRHGISWGCQARADAITEKIAAVLGESGCKYVDVGVESFNNEILAYIKKGLDRTQIIEAIDRLNRHQVPVKLNILIGTSPLETKETIRETLDTAIRLKADQVMINIVAPFPGTEFYTLAKENRWIIGGDYVPTDVQHHSILSYPNLTGKEMERLLFRHNLKFFTRPRFIVSQLRRFSSFSEFWKAAKALKNKLTYSER
ncbi:(Dimethylallyl)adenosine tRNA methylthiotransferase MiaB [Bacteroidales bacterium Barb6XT]|nr:(Dimethylallyl)adenosine tRNA methylthiotransferase MiaB [Bacteroidales bacterium Barb6XT]